MARVSIGCNNSRIECEAEAAGTCNFVQDVWHVTAALCDCTCCPSTALLEVLSSKALVL